MKILIIGGTSAVAMSMKPSLEKIGEVFTAGRRDCDLYIDLEQELKINNFPKNIDVIIHVAAHFGGEDDKQLEQAVNTNVMGTLKTCELAKQLNIKHFILMSSMSASLNRISNYYSIYALTKRQSEEIAQFYCSLNNIDLSILRPTQIYGNNDMFLKHQPFFYHIIQSAAEDAVVRIYGAHDALRNYIHTNDLTEIVLNVIEKKVYGVFYCGNMTDIRYSQIVVTAFKVFDHDLKMAFLQDKEDIPDNVFDKDDSLYRKIGFYPNISMEEGIRMLVEK